MLARCLHIIFPPSHTGFPYKFIEKSSFLLWTIKFQVSSRCLELLMRLFIMETEPSRKKESSENIGDLMGTLLRGFIVS